MAKIAHRTRVTFYLQRAGALRALARKLRKVHDRKLLLETALDYVLRANAVLIEEEAPVKIEGARH